GRAGSRLPEHVAGDGVDDHDPAPHGVDGADGDRVLVFHRRVVACAHDQYRIGTGADFRNLGLRPGLPELAVTHAGVVALPEHLRCIGIAHVERVHEPAAAPHADEQVDLVSVGRHQLAV